MRKIPRTSTNATPVLTHRALNALVWTQTPGVRPGKTQPARFRRYTTPCVANYRLETAKEVIFRG